MGATTIQIGARLPHPKNGHADFGKSIGNKQFLQL